MNRPLAGFVCVGIALLVGCNRAGPQTASPLPVPPGFSINAEMVGLVDHAAHALWGVEREGHAPKSDEDWAPLPTFGQFTQAAAPQQIQLAVKIQF